MNVRWFSSSFILSRTGARGELNAIIQMILEVKQYKTVHTCVFTLCSAGKSPAIYTEDMVYRSSTFALVTGASSGLGVAFARRLASDGHHLVLTARRQEYLEDLATELRAECGVKVEVLVADLTDSRQVQLLVNRLLCAEDPVEILVNNAGFGLGKSFDAAPVEQHMQQVEVLAKVPLQLMHAALTGMLQRGRGRIINVCSVAAFTPGGTYSAVKRFMLSISESAHVQYRRRGISVTAVCPGLIHTDFHRSMNVSAPRVPEFFWLSAQRVADDAVRANLAGKARVIPSLPYKGLVALARVTPSGLTSRVIARPRPY